MLTEHSVTGFDVQSQSVKNARLSFHLVASYVICSIVPHEYFLYLV